MLNKLSLIKFYPPKTMFKNFTETKSFVGFPLDGGNNTIVLTS